jgi:hypothetical protein
MVEGRGELSRESFALFLEPGERCTVVGIGPNDPGHSAAHEQTCKCFLFLADTGQDERARKADDTGQ